MRLLMLLAGAGLMTSCAAAISSRPCPRVTEFPVGLQEQAADELLTAPALRQMTEAMAIDRAFNRAICR